MGFKIGGAIKGGITGFATGGWAGAAAGAAAGGFLTPDTPSFNAPQFVPIEGIDTVDPITGRTVGTGVPNAGFNPGGVQTGNAQAGVDPVTGQLTSSIGANAQGAQNQLVGLGQGFLNEASTFNPDQFGANVSDRLRRLAAPQEEQARLQLENRLQAQGLLSSSVGAERQGRLQDAQALAENQRVVQGFSLGQDVQGNLLNRGTSAFNSGFGLDRLGSELFNTSLEQGRGDLAGQQFQLNQQRGLFTDQLKADQLSFASQIDAGKLEIANQKATVGAQNSFNQTNAADQFQADKLSSDADSAFLSGVLGGIGNFAGGADAGSNGIGGGGLNLGGVFGTVDTNSANFDNFINGTNFEQSGFDYFNNFKFPE